ncbi:MAG: STT3 domain-containing protein, partial [Desulfitobacteriaceae bacterium]|nr:STT3 domain-containing protein [Desulfitobacteriaceae bacterium]
MNYRRWLLVGYLLVLMAFTTSVLLIPGEKYDTLTTSDSGFFFGIAREINENNGMVEKYSLSHAPYGLPVGIVDQGQPLITVMFYRAISALNPNIGLMDVVRYWGPLLFALSLIPIFLIGRELGGDLGGCAAAFFGATLTSSIYWMKVGAFDREPIQLILGAWTIYLTIKLFKAPRSETPKFALLAGLVYGLFGLIWSGALFIAPVVVGGLLFVLLVGFFGKLIRKTTDLFGALLFAIRNHLDLLAGVLGMLAVTTLALWVIAGQSPIIWTGFARSLLGYVGIGVSGEGISFTRYAGEMATPNSWDDIVYRMYGSDAAAILTLFVFALILLGLLKFCWSRKRWELLVFPWLIVIAAMVWPGRGQVRFERMWWPFVPILAGVGAAALVSLVRRLSFEQFGEWLRHFQRPVVIAFSISLVATPFIFNAYTVAEGTTPPTEWHGGLGWRDEGFMDAFTWLGNTPENSVVAIQWSYGHLLTGTSRRATVADGTETMGELGKWENVASIQPPDYIYYVSDSRGLIYGMDVPARSYQVNGRRIDVARFPTMDENEFRWIIRTYRDNYGCKIDYIVFDASEYYSARNYYNVTQPAN